MANQFYIAMNLHPGRVHIDGTEVAMKLPEGCRGILFAFKTKKSGREFFGKKCQFTKVEIAEPSAERTNE